MGRIWPIRDQYYVPATYAKITLSPIKTERNFLFQLSQFFHKEKINMLGLTYHLGYLVVKKNFFLPFHSKKTRQCYFFYFRSKPCFSVSGPENNRLVQPRSLSSRVNRPFEPFSSSTREILPKVT